MDENVIADALQLAEIYEPPLDKSLRKEIEVKALLDESIAERLY